MVQTIVYRGEGPTGVGLFGHVLGIDYTFEITPRDPSPFVDIAQVPGGFLFSGNISGTNDDGLFFSDGSGDQRIEFDDQGDLVGELDYLVSWGDQAVYKQDRFDDRLFLTDGANAPKLFIDDDVDDFLILGDDLYAQVNNDLVRYDQSGASEIVVDGGVDASGLFSINYFFEFQDDIFIRGRNGSSTAHSFYRYDTDSGQVTDTGIAYNTGGDSLRFFDGGVGETQFFGWINDPVAGIELHVSDGSPNDFRLVADIDPGSSSSYTGGDVAMLGDTLFFWADDGTFGAELWTSDGTTAGTVRLSGSDRTIGALNESSIYFQHAVVNDMMYFIASLDSGGNAIFKSDGTVAGTQSLASFLPVDGDEFIPHAVVGDSLIFSATMSNDTGDALWTTDGTAAGTYVISDPNPAGGFRDAPQVSAVVDLDIDNIPVREVLGDDADNLLEGSLLHEVLNGLAGHDTLEGAAGNDVLLGGTGSDSLDGGSGADSVNGGLGADTLLGREGDDTLNGGDSNDLLFGANGDDVLNGQNQRDTIHGGDGDDTINGANGGDSILGGDGNDSINAGTGNDYIDGGEGDDFILGLSQNDTLLGNTGRDHLDGGNGQDSINGGLGADTLLGDLGNDVLNGGDSNDLVLGGEGDDTLRGQNQQDTIDGGLGDDALFGGAGGDTFVFGNGFGNDTIFGFAALNSEKIDLSAVSAITDFDDLLANHLVDFGGDALIVRGINSILLDGVAFADVGVGLAYSGGDFIF